MPSLSTARRISRNKTNGAKTIGQIIKEQSDFVMEETWDSDIQSKVCYIYDYFHDDQPELNYGMTYYNTSKTKLDVKFIITTYGSMSKDQVEYHILFKPSQKLRFEVGDKLYYFEQDYVQRYKSEFPIGLYIDIPDDSGVYRKYIICRKEIANQFVKYSVLPCDYRLCWVEKKADNSYLRRMWCCLRSQNSYTNGLWSDYRITSLDNVDQLILPLNSISENIHYVSEDGNNQRIIISALIKSPSTWKVSKIQTTKPFGLMMLTYKQDEFDEHTDYIDWENQEMWADYYNASEILPIDTNTLEVIENSQIKKLRCELQVSTNSIKIGGSYKLITAYFYDEKDNDITDNFKSNVLNWSCFVNNNDLTSDKLITWLKQDDFNKIKIKFGNDRSFLEETLIVKCEYNNIIGSTEFELTI